MTETELQMRPSRVLRRMRAGEMAICAKTNLADPRVVEIIGQAGFDCAWSDMEHVPNTTHDVENQIRASKMFDMDSMVRVRRGSYSDLILPLEMDATGIMVPHLMSLEEAKRIVYYTKFHPIGRRPWDGGNADGKFCMMPPDAYREQANRERFVAIQIEDPEPLAELDEIAALEGIDMLFFGPGDFSQGIGKPGQYDDAEIDVTRQRVAEAARKNGKFAGTMASIETLPRLREMGYQFVNVTADVVILAQSLAELAASLGRAGFELPNSIYQGRAK
jgi:4-hydroxy-2-oxoheptanedioate aldolase